jgi:hypothetical protein
MSIDIDAMERLANAGVTRLSEVKALIAEARALREIQAANVEIKLALHLKTLDLAEEKIALKAELNAWRLRFQAYVYRPQDDCVANRMWLARNEPNRDCPKCGEKDLPASVYCKGMDCPLNPSRGTK